MVMKNIDHQSQRELSVFMKFARVYPNGINLDSIEKRNNREPDIFCTLQDKRPMAFELTEIIDENLARTLWSNVNISVKLQKMQSTAKLSIMNNFADADISITFYETVPTKPLLKSLENILDYLLTLEQREGLYCLNKQTFKQYVKQTEFIQHAVNQKGHLVEQMQKGMPSQMGDYFVYLKSDDNLAEIVKSIRLTRGNFKGPIFSCVPHGVWSSFDLPENRIKSKFKKQYETECSNIELLCYFELQPDLPEDFWLPQVRTLVENDCKGSPFQRIWIYSVTRNEILYVSSTDQG